MARRNGARPLTQVGQAPSTVGEVGLLGAIGVTVHDAPAAQVALEVVREAVRLFHWSTIGPGVPGAVFDTGGEPRIAQIHGVHVGGGHVVMLAYRCRKAVG